MGPETLALRADRIPHPGELRLAHISNIHLGRSEETLVGARQVRDALERLGADHVVLTGDVTHRGRADEWALFERLFAPLLQARKITVVPGNHDRLGDGIARRIMPGRRVEVVSRPGLHLVRVDSTGPHNRFLLAGHGDLCGRILDEIDDALGKAPAHALAVVMLHHHPLPLPEETLPERLASRLGWPYAAELRLGHALLSRIAGRCDLVLHGHRHQPRGLTLAVAGQQRARPLGVYNAGCTPSLGRFRLFAHQEGALSGPPLWVDAADLASRRTLPAIEAAS